MTIAHKITKKTVEIYGCNYSATLSIVLKDLHKAAKRGYDSLNNWAKKESKEKSAIAAVEKYQRDINLTSSKVYSKNTQIITKTTHSHIKNGLCPICGTYCYGDCQINRAM